MNYKIEKNAGPAYMQLYAQIRGEIISGAYEYGARLPSKRLVAEETGVSVITVEHAYAILCDEGYAEARPRSGYFAAYRTGDFASDPAPVPHREFGAHAALGEYAFPYSVMAKTARRIISDYGERFLVKSPNRGCAELRAAITGYLRRSCGIEAAPEQVIIGAGAEYLYGLAVQLLGLGRKYALEDPSYEKIRRVYAAYGARYDMIRMARDGLDSAALAASDADCLHVTPFNSFPSGVTASASKRREYLEWARARDGFIVEDNYDSELTVSRKNEDTLFSLSGDGRVIYINTFSRTVAPALRVGYMVLPERLLPVFEERLGFCSCTVPTFEQILLAELLDTGDFERHVNRVRRRKRREQSGQ